MSIRSISGWVLGTMLVGALACSGSPTNGGEDGPVSRAEAQQAQPGQEVALAVGGSVRWQAQGVLVTYRRLVGDSRCPLQAICVWEGDAEVLIEVTEGSSPAREVRLHTTLSAGPRTLALGSWTLELVRVDPYPSVNRASDPQASQVVLRLFSPGG